MGLLGLMLGAIAMLAMTFGASAASAAPWACSANGYLFQSPEGRTGPHLVEQVDLATGEYSNFVSTEGVVNATGFNQLDNYIYGFSTTEIGPGEAESHLVRINADGSFEELPWPAALPAPTEIVFVVGDVDSEGHYFIASGESSYLIDLAPGSPTYGEVIAEGEYGAPAGFFAPVDVAYINGAYYGVAPTQPLSTAPAHLMRYTIGGAPQDLGPVTGVPADGNYGAVYADASGYLYASNNTTGLIYRIDPATNASILVAEGPKSGSNDGARCASAPIPTVTVTKTVQGRARSADQFTVALLKPDGSEATAATTVGTATTVSTTNFPASEGKTYTITDAMASGSTSKIGEYTQSIRCTDSGGNVVPTGGSGPSWTLTIAAATFYTCNVTNAIAADLEAAKSASPSPAVPGEDETYTLTVKNNGPSPADETKVTDPLPPGLSFVSADPACGFAGGTVTCATGTLAPGATRSYKVVTKVASSVDHRIKNTATVHSSTPDPEPKNNESTAETPVGPQADLELAKSASPSPAVPGEDETYTLTVKNNGPSPAVDAEVTDHLPSELSFVSADPGCTFSGGTVTCAAGTLASGATQSFKVVTKVAASATHRVRNTAAVHSSTPDPEPKNNEATTETPVGPKSDLRLAKTASTGSVSVGGQVMYTLVVANKGPSAATGVTVEDPLPTGLSLVSVQPSQGRCSGTTCHLGTLAAGGSAQVLVTANVTGGAGRSVTNTARVTGDQPDSDPHNNEGTSTVEVKPNPEATFDLAVKKWSKVKKPVVGQKVAYIIAVRNTGPEAAPDTKVTDTLNQRVRVVSVKPGTGSCTKGNAFVCELGTIQPGRTVKVKAVVQVVRVGGQRNAAGATAKGNDSDPGNNLSVLKQHVRKVRLKLTKVANHKSVHPGQLIDYTIKLHNRTRGIAKKVRVCDRIPSGLALVRSEPKGKLSNGRLCWTVGRLGRKATKRFVVVTRALSSRGGRKVNRVTARGPDAVAAKAASAVAVMPAPLRSSPVTG